LQGSFDTLTLLPLQSSETRIEKIPVAFGVEVIFVAGKRLARFSGVWTVSGGPSARLAFDKQNSEVSLPLISLETCDLVETIQRFW
jgi:hypothetical protein